MTVLHKRTGSPLVQVMACPLSTDKSLLHPILTHSQLYPQEHPETCFKQSSTNCRRYFLSQNIDHIFPLNVLTLCCTLNEASGTGHVCHIGSSCLYVPNVPVGTSGCVERVCLHRDGCAPMRSAYPESPDPNLSSYPGQDDGCRR